MRNKYFCIQKRCEGSGFINERSIKSHYANQHKHLRYPCTFCWNQFATKAEAILHRALHKTRKTEDCEMNDDHSSVYSEVVQHSYGELSYAVAPDNKNTPDKIQVEHNGGFGTYVGVYDGHSSHHAENIHQYLLGAQNESMAETTRKIAKFLKKKGSCAVFTVIYDETLYVGIFGDSKSLAGSETRHGVVAEQLKASQITSRNLRKNKLKFIILSTNRLWDLISDEEAVGIVANIPKTDAAKRLAHIAKTRAPEKEVPTVVVIYFG